MPHSCIGALSYYHHNFINYLTSEEAKKVIEATAAGTAIYQATWKKLKPLLLSVIVILVTSMSVTKLEINDAAQFAQRLQICLYPKALKFQSPEPVKHSPNRDANAGFGCGRLFKPAFSVVGSSHFSFGNSPT